MSIPNTYLDALSQFATIDGIRVHYKRQGSGPPLVLIHGSGSSLHSFDELVSGLESKFEVVRLDLPGCGMSEARPDNDYRIQTYVRFVHHFIEFLSLEKFSIAGNSMGGNIAWNFALDYPQRLQKLILMNATGYPGKTLPLAFSMARSAVGRFLMRRLMSKKSTEKNIRGIVGSRTKDVPEAMVNRIYDLMSIPSNLNAFIQFARINQADRSKEICKVKTPTLVVSGDKVDGQYFSGDIKASKGVVIDGVGHLLPEEAPRELIKLITEFCQNEC